jgi:hypothetical protein
MRASSYKLTVVACALSWLLLGLHAPALHGVVHHGRALAPSVAAVVAGLAAAAVASLWALLRAPGRRGSGPAAR